MSILTCVPCARELTILVLLYSSFLRLRGDEITRLFQSSPRRDLETTVFQYAYLPDKYAARRTPGSFGITSFKQPWSSSRTQFESAEAFVGREQMDENVVMQYPFFHPKEVSQNWCMW